MKFEKRIYQSFAKLYPKKYRRDIQNMVDYTGKHYSGDSYLGSSMIFGLIVLIGVILLPWSLYQVFDSMYIIYGVIVFLLIQFTNYLLLYFQVENRTKIIEEVLPDMLQLIASNLKAGMTFFQAIKASLREEFGPLKEEIERATSKSLGKTGFNEALLDISRRVKSGTFDRVVRLLNTGIKAGGNVADILEGISKDMYENKSLKKELLRSSKTYVLFIMFTVLIGTPLLLAISIHFLDSVSSFNIIQDVGFGMEAMAVGVSITSEFLTIISMVMLIITSVLASSLIGTIKEGNLKSGLKYSPLLVLGTILIFYTGRFLVGYLF